MFFFLIRSWRELYFKTKNKPFISKIGYFSLNIMNHFFEFIKYKLLFYGKFKNFPYSESKKCIYTVLINHYDELQDPEFITPGWDYICYTNNTDIKSSVWKLIQINDNDLICPFRLNRKYKCLNHLVDASYDLSIYMDSNLQILGNLDKFINSSFSQLTDIAVVYHKHRLSVKQEVDACIENKKDSEEKIHGQFNDYIINEKFTDQMMLSWNTLIIRKTNQPTLKLFMEHWFNEIMNRSSRDQISFIPSLEKFYPSINFNYIPHWKFNSCFKVTQHIHQRNNSAL